MKHTNKKHEYYLHINLNNDTKLINKPAGENNFIYKDAANTLMLLLLITLILIFMIMRHSVPVYRKG